MEFQRLGAIGDGYLESPWRADPLSAVDNIATGVMGMFEEWDDKDIRRK